MKTIFEKPTIKIPKKKKKKKKESKVKKTAKKGASKGIGGMLDLSISGLLEKLSIN